MNAERSMKKFFIGLTATVIAIIGIFTFVGCEKEETIFQENNNLQLASSFDNTLLNNNIDIATLSELSEMHTFMHVISQQLAAFAFNVESNDTFTNQVNEYCNNILNTDNQELINLYYAMLSQMIFPINELDISMDNNGTTLYCPDNCINQLSTAYNNLNSAISKTLPKFEEMSEELKMQILVQMFEQNLMDNGYIAKGPLEDERDDKIIRATIYYAITLSMGGIENPFIFAAATTVYCREIKAAWREYWAKGGTEPKGTLCKICDL